MNLPLLTGIFCLHGDTIQSWNKHYCTSVASLFLYNSITLQWSPPQGSKSNCENVTVQENKRHVSKTLCLSIFLIYMHFLPHQNKTEQTSVKYCSQESFSSVENIMLNFTYWKWSKREYPQCLIPHSRILTTIVKSWVHRFYNEK